jgi:hypothetical protein
MGASFSRILFAEEFGLTDQRIPEPRNGEEENCYSARPISYSCSSSLGPVWYTWRAK